MVVNASRGLSAIKLWGIWTLGFLSFPLAGLAGMAIAGPVTTPLAAAVGGAITGLVIGAGQWLASARRLRAVRWVSATMIGMGVGLTLGAAVVEYGTSIGELALMGALTGVPLGIAQAFALPGGTRHRWAWAATIPAPTKC